MTPWSMTSGSQFRPAPPPALTSETWTRDLNEIRELGRHNSTIRTAEQTTIGRFWLLTGARTYNPIVRQVAKAKDMDVVDCARLFALVSIAGADAYISVFDGKYAYNLWRPVTAIRNADQTNNPATPRDPHGCRSAIRRCTRNIHARTASPRARCPPYCGVAGDESEKSP